MDAPRAHTVVSDHPGELTLLEFGEATRARPPIVFLPALGVPLAYYRPLLTEWAARGRHLFGVEMRGMPEADPRALRRAPFGYGVLLRHDLPAVFADPVLDGRRVVAVGHSLGGQLALLATAAGTIAPSAVVTIATGSSTMHRGAPATARFRRAAEIALVRLASAGLGYWPGHRLGFGGLQPRTLMRDWAHEARTGRYRVSGDPTDYEAALPSLASRVLLMTIEGDPLITPESVDALARRLPAATDRLTVTAGARDHFLWARRTPKLLIDPLERWLQDGESPTA